jgi:hypothetical protein
MLVLWYLLDLDLSTVVERTVLSTVVVGIPPLCSLSSAPPHAGEGSLRDCRDVTHRLTSVSRIEPLALSRTYMPDPRPLTG